jgi:hypothetical protein
MSRSKEAASTKNHLTQKPMDVTEETWEEFQHKQGHIRRGIRRVLPVRVTASDLSDLTHETYLELWEQSRWLLDLPICNMSARQFAGAQWLYAEWWNDRHLYYSGMARATKWYRNRERKTTTLFTDAERTNDEGRVETFDRPENFDKNEDYLNLDRYLAFATLPALDAQAPEDYALALDYFRRKRVKGHRFTRKESSRFETAMRRLRRLAENKSPRTIGNSSETR